LHDVYLRDIVYWHDFIPRDNRRSPASHRAALRRTHRRVEGGRGDPRDYKWRRVRDKQFFSHVVRRSAVEALRADGYIVDEDEYGRAPLMSSITVRHQGVALRLYRPTITRKGVIEVPLPHHFRKLQSFYRQEFGSVITGLETNNVLGLWHDEKGCLVDPITLVRPLGGDHRKRSLKVHWKGPLLREMATYRTADLKCLEPEIQNDHLDDRDAT
jgi:hypothetical protein